MDVKSWHDYKNYYLMYVILFIFFGIEMYKIFYLRSHETLNLTKIHDFTVREPFQIKRVASEKKSNIIPRPPELVLNAGMDPDFSHTNQIGTVEHPTFDGGIINAADGIPVYRLSLEMKTQKKTETKNRNKNRKFQKADFDDHWITSSALKNSLEKAAQAGKLGYILHQSRQNNLPAGIALLPVVESRYQNHALSSKGALGIWQLMPETAREHGIDAQERTQFMPATYAALHYLNQLHQTFGNWTLALAAYNAGQGRVLQALRKNPKAVSVEQLDLPLETKNYLQQLQQISQLLASSHTI